MPFLNVISQRTVENLQKNKRTISEHNNGRKTSSSTYDNTFPICHTQKTGTVYVNYSVASFDGSVYYCNAGFGTYDRRSYGEIRFMDGFVRMTNNWEYRGDFYIHRSPDGVVEYRVYLADGREMTIRDLEMEDNSEDIVIMSGFASVVYSLEASGRI